MKSKEFKYSQIKSQFDEGIILILTATPIETNATLEHLNPLPGFDSLIKVFEGSLTFVFGKLGNYRVAQVQCGMGSMSRDSSIMTVLEAISLLSPKFILMVGIAFGVDDVNQKVGDVLVSEGVLPYNFTRVGVDETIHRSPGTPCSKILLNRFRSINNWEYILKNKLKANVIFSHLLSGEELIDNIEHREKLTKAYPFAKGGEMEGAGLASACDGKAEWIIIKGICDFANGNKQQDKEENQRTAIDSALSLCLNLFSSKTVFNELGMLAISDLKNASCHNSSVHVNELLFDIYDTKKEKYYIKRNVDNDFIQNVEYYSVWVHGISGCGKTSLISRNLINNNINFVQISLASCVGLNIEELFNEILFDLILKVGKTPICDQPKNFVETSTAILSILRDHFSDKKVVVFIEEIPISAEKGFDEFVEKLFSLIISKSFINGLGGVKFVLSSINSPTQHLQLHQAKVHEKFKFVSLGNWEEKDSNALIELIVSELNLKFPVELINELMLLSDGSPRFIKKYFRNIMACNAFSEEEHRNLMTETQRELQRHS